MDTKTAPVLTGSITAGALIGLFKALLIAFRTMGWGGLTPDQEAAWLDVADIAFPMLVTALTGWWIARRTTPLAQPTDTDGTRLIRSSDKQPAIEEQKTIAKEIFRERKA